jgi:ornithine cyclodeaminase/alanine dehydrogenase-like protein (mu-crystallin family)
VSVRSQNPSFGLPLVPASILHVDAMTGIVDAIIAGTYATACRTAAGR